jgi:RNA polymerase sigma-70 factor (ECF subfamily)
VDVAIAEATTTGRPGRVRRPEQFESLYEAHVGLLLGYVVKLTDGDRAWAEDVVQETFLRAWRHPEAFASERGSAQAWLCTVARRLVIDCVRAKKARPTEVGDEQLLTLTAVVEDDHDRILLGWEVAEVMATLTPDHRAVLRETYFKGLSVAETAKVLGVPVGTVKSRTYYALRVLKRAFEQRGIRP